MLSLSLDLTRSGASAPLEPEALAYFARMSAQPDALRKRQISNLIAALKQGGVWARLDAFWLMAAHDADAARLNIVDDRYNLVLVGSPVFIADRGYIGDGFASYLRTGFNPAAAVAPKFTQNSAAFGFWSLTELDDASQEMGNANNVIVPRNGNQALYRLNNGGSASSTAPGASLTSLGLFTCLRNSSTAERLRLNSSQLAIDSSKASQSTANSEFTLMARNTASGAVSVTGGKRRLALAFIGSDLSDSEAGVLYEVASNYLTILGAH